MNTETKRIVSLLQETFNGDPWPGLPIKTILLGISATEAIRHPIPAGHSIWELVSHMTVWRNFAAEKLQGNALFDIMTTQEDWPLPSITSEIAWLETLSGLDSSQHKLTGLLASYKDSQLTEIVPGRTYSFYYLLHGIIQHDFYHLGQIALLKKAVK
ncbi:MAG: DinB family protein [Bacteroidota bacterium]